MRLLIVNINRHARTLDGCNAIADALTDIDPALKITIRHWVDIDGKSVGRLRPAAVILGPNETPFPAYPPAFDDFLAWVRARRGPTLGICGGHQALALAHGSPIGPVHPVAAARRTYAGMPKVTGQVGVRLMGGPAPLLAGLPEEIHVACSHVDEVKEVPPGFRILGVGDPCNIQIIQADRRPMVGFQFHPERPSDTGDGRRLLENWLATLGPTPQPRD